MDANDYAHFAEAAKKYLTKKTFFSVTDESLFQDLVNAEDTTYLLIRGLAVLPLIHWFPPDDRFPEKHRDAEFLRDRIMEASYGAADTRLPGSEDRSGYFERLREKENEFKKRYEPDDFIISGLAAKLSCNIRQRYLHKGCSFVQNMLSDPGEQQSSDIDSVDMALRFHQFFVAGEIPTKKQDLIHSCRFRIFLCCKNLLRMPIYIVRLVDVLNVYLCRYEPEKRGAVLKELSEKNFEFLGPRHDAYSRPITAYGPILKPDNLRQGHWIMCFDHERVRAPEGDTEADKALQELRQAVQRARRDAIRVILKPRQILIVDNLRAMTSRRERVPSTLMDVLRLLPTVFRLKVKVRLGEKSSVGSTGQDVIVRTKWWFFRPNTWLRVYYAFPIER